MKRIYHSIAALALAALPETAWSAQLRVCDAVISQMPSNWEVESTSTCRATLKKTFVYSGYWYEEHIGIQAAADNYSRLQYTLEDLRRQHGFRLLDEQRLAFGATVAPFWVMYRTGQAGESIWLAVVLYRGLTYSVQMRASTLDLAAVTEFGEVLSAFGFLPDERAQAWTKLIEGDPKVAERKFSALLRRDSADANARYGYGLARLAQDDAAGAIVAIERARPQLGVSEDARRALGRAALARGEHSRAAALWLRVIRDHPGWDRELRPWILWAIERAPTGAGQQPAFFDALSDDGASILILLQHIERSYARGQQPAPVSEDGFETVQDDLTEWLSTALDQVLADPQRPTNLRALLAVIDVERGIGLAAKVLRNWNEQEFYEAELLIASGLKHFADAMNAGR